MKDNWNDTTIYCSGKETVYSLRDPKSSAIKTKSEYNYIMLRFLNSGGKLYMDCGFLHELCWRDELGAFYRKC